MIFVFITITILVLALPLVGYIFATLVIYPKRYGYEETRQIETDKGRMDPQQFAAWEKEEFFIPTPHGYDLHAMFFPMPGSRRGVILTHGITYTLFGSVKYMPIFRELGFNILIYDLRHHGKSGGPNATFGFYEKYDLQSVMDWMIQRLGPDAVIGTHGESMGASISLQHAAIDPRTAFVIEDCGYSDLTGQLTYRLGVEYFLPPFPLLSLANLATRLLSGMSFEQVSPIATIGQVSAPVLFIHGEQDGYILPQMARDLYAKKAKGPRVLYLASDAHHAEAFTANPQAYREQVRAFLCDNHIIPCSAE